MTNGILTRWDVGKASLDCIGQKVNRFLGFTDEGSKFLYGYLVDQTPFDVEQLANSSLAFNVTSEINAAKAVFPSVMFKSLSNLYFFSFVVAILAYLGVIQWITIKVGEFLQLTIGTTPCETITTAANIFLGVAMAPMLVKPYLSR